MEPLDLNQARFNMVEQQVRTWEVLDHHVLDVMNALPRDQFVPARYRNLAYADTAIPIGHGQVMMQPKVEGRVLQSLQIEPTDSALEIGTGSGYFAACLSKLARTVVSVEIIPELSQEAEAHLAAQQVGNVTLRLGNGAAGWNEDGQFNVIAVTGSLPGFPAALERQLKIGGRLFVVTGDLPLMEAWLVTRRGADYWTRESMFETDLPPLLEVERPRVFEF